MPVMVCKLDTGRAAWSEELALCRTAVAGACVRCIALDVLPARLLFVLPSGNLG